MANENDYLFVDFKKYCETCKHKDVKETEDPCTECLESPMNLFSHKPVKWEENNKKEKKSNDNQSRLPDGGKHP